MTANLETGKILDLRGYRCPVPVIKLEARLRRLEPGDQVTVITDDPVAAVDIPYYCQKAGHLAKRLTEKEKNGECCVFQVTHSANPAPDGPRTPGSLP